MDFEFNSVEELYRHLLPALKAKTAQLSRIGYSYIKTSDIWDYLSSNKWPKMKGLTLADMVSDIMHLDDIVIDQYVMSRSSRIGRRQYLGQNVKEVL